MDVLAAAEPGATFLLNSPFGPDVVWNHLPRAVQQTIIQKRLKLFVIDGYAVARDTGMGKPNQYDHADLFFLRSAAYSRGIKRWTRLRKRFAKHMASAGKQFVEKNFAAVDHCARAFASRRTSKPGHQRIRYLPSVPQSAPTFVRDVLGTIIAGRGGRVARQHAARGRNVPDGDRQVGEAQHRATGSCVG